MVMYALGKRKDMKNKISVKDFLSVKEFCEQTGMIPVTVRLWVRQKKLRGVKMGGQWIILRSEAEKMKKELNEMVKTLSGE